MTDRELGSVEPTDLTCDQVDERDLEAGYVAGRLSPADAEAFEAHVFACERCWPLLQTALAVAAAGSAAADQRQARYRFPWPLAAAAGLTLMLAGTWWATRNVPMAPEALRGSADSMVLQPQVTAGGVAVSFARIAGADAYRVRVFDGGGELLAERETPDTALSIPLDGRAASGPILLIDVTAMDRLREPLASSGLVRLERDPTGR